MHTHTTTHTNTPSHISTCYLTSIFSLMYIQLISMTTELRDPIYSCSLCCSWYGGLVSQQGYPHPRTQEQVLIYMAKGTMWMWI